LRCLSGIGLQYPLRDHFREVLRGTETNGTRDNVLMPFYTSDEHLGIQYVVTRPI